MLKEAIYIKNFGPLEEVAIPEIKKSKCFYWRFWLWKKYNYETPCFVSMAL